LGGAQRPARLRGRFAPARSPRGQQRERRTHLSGIGTCGERLAQRHRGHRLVAGGGEQTAHLERVG